MIEEIDALRLSIRGRYGSTHGFCRAHPELTRSTVYLVLSGKYPGNTARQIRALQALFDGVNPTPEARPGVTAAEACRVLQDAKCAHCRKLDKRACRECKAQTEREAQALEEYLRSREVV